MLDLDDKAILITGGTGSFGRKLVEILLRRYSPERLIVFSRDELKQYEMRQEGCDHPCMRYFIGDLRDRNRLRRAMTDVDVVIHAAAIRQVETCETNPEEAIKTNIEGAQNVIDAALDSDVKKVLAISSDMAVNPDDMYGATKFIAERLLIQANQYESTIGTSFSCVRFGTFIEGLGSVTPLFLDPEGSGMVAITGKGRTQYLMTLDRGVDFLLEGMDVMVGGEIFIPKVYDLSLVEGIRAARSKRNASVEALESKKTLPKGLISTEECDRTVDTQWGYIVMPHHCDNNDDNQLLQKLIDGELYPSKPLEESAGSVEISKSV